VKVVDNVLVLTGGPAKLTVTVEELPSIGTSHAFSGVMFEHPVHPSRLQSDAGVGVSVTTPPPEKAM